jgi:DNA-directed RNA polymerase specialized sigma subunit
VSAAASKATKGALAAIKKLEGLEEQLKAARQERDRLLLAMHYEEEMTPGQIARVVGCSVALVRMVIKMDAVAREAVGRG